MSEQLYPRQPKRRPQHPERPWRVDYRLYYDDGIGEWSSYYRTSIGARISAFWHHSVASWGGFVELVDQRGDRP